WPSNSTSTTAPITCATRPFIGFVITLPRPVLLGAAKPRLVRQTCKNHPGGDRQERRYDQCDAPERLHSTLSSTDTLPRVAFEYGQTWWAASKSSFTCSASTPGAESVIFAVSAKLVSSLPMPTSTFTTAFEASIFLCDATNSTALLKQVAQPMAKSCS